MIRFAKSAALPRVLVAAVSVGLLAGCGAVGATGPGVVTPVGGIEQGSAPASATAAFAPFGPNAERYGVGTYATQVPSVRADVPADPADVYYPLTPPDRQQRFPTALMLQGGLVDKQYYAEYARTVASFGLVVVVPNHERLLFGLNGLYAEQAQVRDLVPWIANENGSATSPLADRLTPDTVVLLGHSFGGAAGLSAIENDCRIPFCIVKDRDYPARPPELKAAALYGTNLSSPQGDEVPFVDTAGVPIAFIQGSVDGATTPEETQETYSKLSGGTKAIVTIDGANHFGLVNAANGQQAGADRNVQTLAQDVSVETSARWSAAFLLAFLGDAAALEYVTATGDPADPVVSVTAYDIAQEAPLA